MDPRYPHSSAHHQPLVPQPFTMHPSALHQHHVPTSVASQGPMRLAPPLYGHAPSIQAQPPQPQPQQQHHHLQHHGQLVDQSHLDSMLDPRSGMRAFSMASAHSMAAPPPPILAPAMHNPQLARHVALRPMPPAPGPPPGGGAVGMGLPGQALAPAPPGAPRNGVAGGSAAATQSSTPQKDSDGKFPCPNCNKTYLHAKHLKRHLLRHTGDRPYQCILCKDTFSRSDILKRHFQKCSIRRGNPTGATHLSQHHANQQAKAKAAQAAQQAANTSTTSSPITPQQTSLGSSQVSPTSTSHRRNSSLGGALSSRPCDQCQDLKMPCDMVSPCDRCKQRGIDCTFVKQTKRPASGTQGNRRRTLSDLHTASVLDTSMQAQTDFSPLHDGYTMSPAVLGRHEDGSGFGMQSHRQAGITSLPGSRTTSISSSSYHVSPHVPQPNHELDWGSILQNETPYDSFQYGENAQHAQVGSYAIPKSSYSGAGSLQSVYQNGAGTLGSRNVAGMGGIAGTSYSAWNNISMPQMDPLQSKSETLVHWLFPSPSHSNIRDAYATFQGDQDRIDSMLRQWITPDNIQHFVDLALLNFQGHFPLIHIPTYRTELADNGLVMTLACIGAVYSDRGITVDNVRLLMDRVKSAMYRTHKEQAIFKSEQPSSGMGRPAEIEEVQAVILMSILETWHGNRKQRDQARKSFGEVVAMVRRAKFLEPLDRSSSQQYSVHHQLDPGRSLQSTPSIAGWNWTAWIEQEKRTRAMYAVWLLDTAYVIYFNVAPRFGAYEVKLPLPSDDAPFEANDAITCANMLGLNGPEAQAGNISGSQRIKQLEFSYGVKALLHPKFDLKVGSTNAYSKFILVHALHVHIWMSQQSPATYNSQFFSELVGSGAGAANLATSDFVLPSNDSNGVDGSVEGAAADDTPEAKHFARLINNALQKWKKAWDTDLNLQFPVSSSRTGFYRDGLPFYWLAKLFMARNRTTDWKHSYGDEKTILQVKKMLKHVRSFIFDGDGRIDLQGAVANWDETYGVDELTFDMKLLFTPIDQADLTMSPGLPWS